MNARRLAALSACVFALGCASRAHDTRPAPAEPSGAAPAARDVKAPSDPVRMGALPSPLPESVGSKIFLPPAEHGTARTQVLGCLSDDGEGAAARYPARPVVRGGPAPVTVAANASGVIVTHELSHPCCLKAEVSTKTEGPDVRVVERLVGTPCKCECSSTLKTAVGLRPGDYQLIVAVERDGGIDEVHRAPIAVQGLKR